jgi:hypothetical protein
MMEARATLLVRDVQGSGQAWTRRRRHTTATPTPTISRFHERQAFRRLSHSAAMDRLVMIGARLEQGEGEEEEEEDPRSSPHTVAALQQELARDGNVRQKRAAAEAVETGRVGITEGVVVVVAPADGVGGRMRQAEGEEERERLGRRVVVHRATWNQRERQKDSRRQRGVSVAAVAAAAAVARAVAHGGGGQRSSKVTRTGEALWTRVMTTTWRPCWRRASVRSRCGWRHAKNSLPRPASSARCSKRSQRRIDALA